MLRRRGEQLRRQRADTAEINIWLAAVDDELKHTLPQESSLFQAFRKIWQPELEWTEEARADRIQQVIRLLELASVSPPIPPSPPPPPSPNEAEIPEHQIQWYVNEKYFGSWLFRIPILVLIAAASFAILGTIQIQGVQFDLRQLAKDSVEAIKLDLNEQQTEIEAELTAHGDLELARISQATDAHIATLQAEMAPDIEESLSGLTETADLLGTKVPVLESRLDSLESTVRPLENSLDVINSTSARSDLATVALFSNAVFRYSFFVPVILALISLLIVVWRLIGSNKIGWGLGILLSVAIIVLIAMVISPTSTVQQFYFLSDNNPQSTIEVTFLHLNDVYEIEPISNGQKGGLARVATLRQELIAQNPNTFTVLAGDLFSPSALGTEKALGEGNEGQQMVAVMGALGLDFATFGNHEFDIDENSFRARLEESGAAQVTWISSNVFDQGGKPFESIPQHKIVTVVDESGRQLRIGLFGLTIDDNEAEYVTYMSPIDAAKQQIDLFLQDEVDIIVAITHLSIGQDVQLAQTYPEIDLIIGGHEHENMFVEVQHGEKKVPIFRADANAVSAYVHHLTYHTETGTLQIDSELVLITEQIPEDESVAQEVESWVAKAAENYEKQGFNLTEPIATLSEPLDGREASVRRGPTNLTAVIAKGMLNVAQGAEIALFNSGSVRVDDFVEGELTEYDVLRIMPFEGTVWLVEMQGDLLQMLLDEGRKAINKGGYLQTINVELANNKPVWIINGAPLNSEQMYHVAINDFVLEGNEKTLSFMKDNQGVRKIKEFGDIRKALIEQIRRDFGDG